MSAQSPSFTEMTIAGTSRDDIYSLALFRFSTQFSILILGLPK